MKAVLSKETGGPETLVVEDIDAPTFMTFWKYFCACERTCGRGGDAARCPSYGALAPVYEGRVHGT